MAENVENVALKARKTKLNNKSKEELIAIILRKDDVEKKLTSKLDSAKDQVVKLTDSLAESNKKMNEEIHNGASLKASNNSLTAKNQSLSESLAGSQICLNRLGHPSHGHINPKIPHQFAICSVADGFV